MLCRILPRAVRTGAAALAIALALTWLGASAAQGQIVPDRRKEQFPTQPAHLFVPLPFSLPGIGQGIFWLANLPNVLDTTADISAIYVTGDITGYVLAGFEVPVYPDRLLLDFLFDDFSRGSINNYESRGMDTEKDDYNIIEFKDLKESSATLTLTLYERRLNAYLGTQKTTAEITALRDHTGELLVTLDDPYHYESKGTFYGLRLDVTDDYQDPRRGLRLMVQRTSSPAANANEAEFDTMDYNLLGYIPIGRLSTLALNYYRSDAVVSRKGVTDRAAIQEELGVVCDNGDTACQAALDAQIDNTIAARSNGTAATLGGRYRLRAYPQGRFQGGHMAFYGAELRLNLTEEATPFDYFIWKDVRTGLQWALFAESGTVSETADGLWDESRNSYGTGFRLISASGSVYRADIAFGDEGSQVTIFFFYPWE